MKLLSRRDFLKTSSVVAAAMFGGGFIPVRSLSAASIRLVPSQYATIQSAIDASVHGDIIIVSPGIYYENINLHGKNVWLRAEEFGWGAWSRTTIHGTGAGATIRCSDGATAETVIEGFTVTGGSGETNGGIPCGGGVFVYYASPTIRSCHFKSNQAGNGGGAALINSGSAIWGCLFTGNVTSGAQSVGGGGAWIQNSACDVEACVFADNVAGSAGTGGGLFVVSSDVFIRSTNFLRNTAYRGGGTGLSAAGAWCDSCTWKSNTAISSGGGFRVTGSSSQAHIRNSIVWENVASNNAGVHIVTGSNATVNMTCTDVAYNGPGAGIIFHENPQFAASQDLFSLVPSPTSPYLNTADNSLSYPFNPFTEGDVDAAGNPRICGSATDLGAYEYQGVPAPACAGDTNYDTSVNNQDALNVLNYWDTNHPLVDLNDDGVVGQADLISVLNNWGKCP